MVNVGLVTGPVAPSAPRGPRARGVFPVPSSPCRRTTSPGRSVAASAAPRASVASGEVVRTGPLGAGIAGAQPQAQADAAEEQRDAGGDEPALVEARARQLAGGGRGGVGG